MDKVKFTTFGIMPKPEEKVITIGEGSLTVTTFLPYETVLEMIQWSINMIMDDRGFISEPIHQIIEDMAVLKYYTNLDLDELDMAGFTQGQLYEMYDMVKAHDLVSKVCAEISAEQLSFYRETLTKTLQSLIAYRNSAAGLMEMIQINGENTSASLQKSLDILGDKEQFDQVYRMLDLVAPKK